MSINKIKLVLCIFIPFLSFFLMSHNTFAVQVHSWLNIRDISKTNLSNDWITHDTSDAGSYSVSGSTSLQTYNLSASASLSSPLTGPYFNLNGTIYIQIPNDLDGGVICSALTNGGIVLQTASTNITSSSVTNCYYESVSYYNKYTININTIGSISSGSPTKFYFYLLSEPNNPFISLIGTPNNSPRVFISGEFSFSSSSSPELNSLSEINQNIVVISQDLQDLSNQMEQNTQSIIDNQNQNTEDIIKSNQKCVSSKNIFDGWTIGKILSATNGSEITNQNGAVSSSYLPVNPDTNYVFSGLPTGLYTFIAAYNSNHEFLGRTSANGGVSTKTFKTVPVTFSFGTPVGSGSISYVRITAYQSGNYNDNISVINSLQTQLETGTTPTTYIPIGQEICKNINEEYYDEQRQADQNISNQTTSDIDGATNQQTTNLIGTISSFVSALSSINTNGSCQLTLPFPSLLGGNQVVNPCNGADKAPAIITAASSLLLITVFVPLAFILVKMIYNEIRSFTNG